MLSMFRRAFGLICLFKALDILGRSGFGFPGFPPQALAAIAMVAIMAASALALVFDYKHRIAAATMALIFPISWFAFGNYNHHHYLIAVVALILAIDIQVSTLLRAQLSVVYGYAAITKVNESFLSGTELHISLVELPFWGVLEGFELPAWVLISLSIGAICSEAFLAVALWHHNARWVALAVGVAFHLVMMISMPEDALHFIRLSVYGFMLLALYMPFFEKELDGRWAQIQGRNAKATVPILG